MTSRQKAILQHLQKGQAAAIHSVKLSELTGISERVLRREIATMRYDEGLPIMSNSSGYWIAASLSELTEFSRTMKKRAISSFQARKGAEHILKYIADSGCHAELKTDGKTETTTN